MIGLILIFLLAFSVFQSLNTFEYEGLSFTKEQLGEIPLYRYYYYINDPITGQATGEPHQINLYLRVDPRENIVPIEGEILFQRGKTSYISINSTGLEQCKYSQVAISSLTSFLTANGVQVKGAVPDEEKAQTGNFTYAICGNPVGDVVLLIESGDETKITKEDTCYRIEVANCDIISAIEKFQVQSLIDGMERNL
ncbi:hypothetical protein HY450_00345 [Candidatus Pacearchaeota archaeon]|nr:hypothetical protein [Candidatus Pacearchaeota archaeon]